MALARSQPKPGWTLAARATPTDILVCAGGPLDDQHDDEFVVPIKTPDRAGGTLRLPVAQGCAAGREARWEGANAPTLRLTAPVRH